MFKKIKIEEGKITVSLEDKGQIYKGVAKIHPEDEDLANDKTGIQIATMRAKITRHDKKAKEYQKQIDALLKEIAIAESARDFHIENKKLREEFLNVYLQKKEAFYKKIRENRKNPRSLEQTVIAIEKAFNKLAEVKNDGAKTK